MKCRHCASHLHHHLIDLGSSPPSNAFLTESELHLPEKWYPLRALVCSKCWLVQTEDFAKREELFNPRYAYFSSFSTTWLTHAERYVSEMIARFRLNHDSHVIEVAANDGYLLQFFKQRKIPCTGIEPTASTAAAARKKEIPIIEEFFGTQLAKNLVRDQKQADLIVANNVLAHVPNLVDFVSGFSLLLNEKGVATFEFQYLPALIRNSQFDTIYHEHYSYLSLLTVDRIFGSNGLLVFDVEQLPTHGGSVRVFAQRSDVRPYERSSRVDKLLELERKSGVMTLDYYSHFQTKVDSIKNSFLKFLLTQKDHGESVVGYGAAAKASTLLNYAGIKSDLIEFVVDRNPAKQNKYMPGSRIRIVEEGVLNRVKPNFIVIFAWNIKDEIERQLEYVRSWGGRFVTVIPELTIE